jgi:hypothetical protein
VVTRCDDETTSLRRRVCERRLSRQRSIVSHERRLLVGFALSAHAKVIVLDDMIEMQRILTMLDDIALLRMARAAIFQHQTRQIKRQPPNDFNRQSYPDARFVSSPQNN